MFLDKMNKKLFQKGYTLLFAIIVSSLVLAVAVFIVSLTRKQFVLSTAARDSNVAIYAADSGIECVEEYYQEQWNYFSTSTEGSVTCGATTVKTYPNYFGTQVDIYAATSTFFVPIGTTGSCVQVDVGYAEDQTHMINTNIIARGYNIGWNASGGTFGTGDCGIVGPRKVERAIWLRYGL